MFMNTQFAYKSGDTDRFIWQVTIAVCARMSIALWHTNKFFAFHRSRIIFIRPIYRIELIFINASHEFNSVNRYNKKNNQPKQ